jgi:hypothetical protein
LKQSWNRLLAELPSKRHLATINNFWAKMWACQYATKPIKPAQKPNNRLQWLYNNKLLPRK